MSKIPYSFTGIPNFLIESGWTKDHKTLALFVHLFYRIRYEPHVEVIEGSEIHLEAYEFVFGRDSVAIEIGVSAAAVQRRLGKIVKSKMIIKVISKSTSKYTVYKWVKEHFMKCIDQQIDQQTDQQTDQQAISNPITKKKEIIRSKIEDGSKAKAFSPPPTPKTEKVGGGAGKRKERFEYPGEISKAAQAAHARTLKHDIPISADKIQHWIDRFGINAVRIEIEATIAEHLNGNKIRNSAFYAGKRLANNHVQIKPQGKIYDINSALA